MEEPKPDSLTEFNHLAGTAGIAARLEMAARRLHKQKLLKNPYYTKALCHLTACRGRSAAWIYAYLHERAPAYLAMLWREAGLKRPEGTA